MPTIELGRVMPVDKGAWVSNTKYMKMDIVDYNEKSYYCVKSHISSSSSTPEDRTYWIAMTGDGANKVSYDRVVIDRGNLLYSEDPYMALLSIDINSVDYYKVLAPSGTGAFVVGLFDRPVTTEEEFMYRWFGGAMESSQIEAQDTTNTSDDIIVDSLGIAHPAPRILENGNHLKTIMIDIECTNIGYENENGNAGPMLLDLDYNSDNDTSEAWGPGYEITFIEWPPCVFWPNDTPPEFSGNRCVFLLVSYDGGYTWIGMPSAINVPVYDYSGSGSGGSGGEPM